jgi:hypothetical protein
MSLDGAARVHHLFQILTLAFGLLTAASSVLLWVSGARLGALRSAQQEAERRTHAAADDALRAELEAARSVVTSSERRVEDLKHGQEPRRLGDEARERFASMLRAAAPGTIDLVAVKGDPESLAFARDLQGIFGEVGWTAAAIREDVFKEPPLGLFLVVHSAETAPRCAGPLQQALEAAGFPAQGEAHRDRPSGSLTLVVGRMP